jgi:molybdopterin-guanine dinucleotide biosynthesis protein A
MSLRVKLTETNLPAATIAILAGGQSQRMRTDKSFVVLHEKPVIEHVLTHVKAFDLPIVLITNSPDKYAKYKLPTFEDVLPDHGALGGIYTAICSSQTDHTLCVACDMPFLNAALLRYLIDLRTEADVVVPRIGGLPEAMHAVYSKACLAAIQSHLAQRKLKASGFYQQVGVRYVEEAEIRQFDPDLRSFINLNTPDDLRAAQEMTST